MTRARSLPLGLSLAIAFAVAVVLPALAAGATWLAVGARQQAAVDARVEEATKLVTQAAGSWDEPGVRERVLRRLAALDVEADLQDPGRKLEPVVVEPGVPPRDSVPIARPLITKQLQAVLTEPLGKREVEGRYQNHKLVAGTIAGTLYVAGPSTAVRLAATCGAGLLALAIALVAGVVLLRRWVVRPLVRLAADAERIAGGDLDVAHVRSRMREVDDVGAALRGMAEGLRGAISERDAAEEQRRFLVSAVAHDLRTPLFTLRGSLEAIEHGIGNGDQLRRAQDKATLLDRLVGDLFAFSRLEFAEPRLEREVLDAAALAREAADTVGEHVAVEAQPGMPEVLGDRSALLRVLVNLLDNAVRHADGTVVVRVHADGRVVVFDVEDDGPGIADSDLPRLFDPLFRADRTRNSATGGSGLGLAIVHRLTRAHGGSVHAENRREGGARFVVRIPAAAARPVATAELR